DLAEHGRRRRNRRSEGVCAGHRLPRPRAEIAAARISVVLLPGLLTVLAGGVAVVADTLGCGKRNCRGGKGGGRRSAPPPKRNCRKNKAIVERAEKTDIRDIDKTN
ncbi:hypothetical protein Dimus_019731, partial [Dionaea muscipula]